MLKRKYLITKIILLYILSFGILIKHTTSDPAYWWYLPVLFPLLILFFSIEIAKLNKKFVIIILLVFIAFNLNKLNTLKRENLKTAQVFYNAEKIVSTIRKDIANNENPSYYLEFLTMKESVNGHTIKEPFIYNLSHYKNIPAQKLRKTYSRAIKQEKEKVTYLYLITDISNDKQIEERMLFLKSKGFVSYTTILKKNNINVYRFSRLP